MADEGRQRATSEDAADAAEVSSRPKVRFNQKKSKTWRLFALCAVVLVPLVYAALFLIAANDPYGGMNQVPAVVVNLDKGAEIDGEERNVGQELSDALIEDNALAVEGDVSGFNWSFTTSEAKAAQSLRDGAYYMEVIIPEGFSEAIASAGTKDATQAELEVYYNPAASFSAQTIGKNLIVRIVDKLNEQIQGDYFSSIFLTIKEAGSDLLTVANAGLDLSDGLFTARDGSAELADGLGQIAEGNAELTSGLYEAGDGATQLAQGASQLAEGVQQLASGLGQLKQGIESSSSSPETVALANAMAQVGSYLQAYGAEASKSDPDTAAEQAYLEGAASAAQDAAAANATLGDPLVAYISGGTFSYTSGSTTVTSTETGLIPALAAYVAAENALVEFETNELGPLLAELEQLRDAIGDMSDLGAQAKVDLEAYNAAVANQQQCAQLYQAAVSAYADALADFAAGKITEAELAAYAAAVQTASTNMANAESAVAQARSTMAYDFYHTDAAGNPAGLLPDIASAVSIASDLWGQIGSVDRIEELVNELMDLITEEATAGAAAQGAAGKCEGYLVGVAVTSAYASGSTSQLAEAINQIYSAVAVGSGDSTSLVDGTDQLASGASSLAEGIYTAADGSNTITLSLDTVASGSESLTDGMTTAANTSNTLFEGLLSGKDDLDEQTENSEVRSDVLSSPVTVNGESQDGESIVSVANYGTSMAPYYLGLGLWLGCLLATLILRPVDERRFAKRGSSLGVVLAGYLPLAGIAVAQILIAMAVVQFGLNMNVSFPAAYYLAGVVAALAFAALNQLLVGGFGMGGLIASVVLLAAQLCMASGTFPIESAFSVLGIASMLMPMTYVVRGLRVAMCGLGAEYVAIPVAVLAGVAILALLLTVLVVAIRRKVARGGSARKAALAGAASESASASAAASAAASAEDAGRAPMTNGEVVAAACFDEGAVDVEDALEIAPAPPTSPAASSVPEV